MKLVTTFALALTLSSGALGFQQEFKPSANPVEAIPCGPCLARSSKNLVAAAELLPAEKYGYQPTPAQMTFGQLIALHRADERRPLLRNFRHRGAR